MSTIKADKLVAKSNEAGGITPNNLSMDTVVKGTARSWANLNGGGTAVVRGSFNISSFTRASQSVYSVVFSSALSTSNYSATYSHSADQAGSSSGGPYGSCLFSTSGVYGNLGSTPTVNGFGFNGGNWGASGFTDPSYICISVQGY